MKLESVHFFNRNVKKRVSTKAKEVDLSASLTEDLRLTGNYDLQHDRRLIDNYYTLKR